MKKRIVNVSNERRMIPIKSKIENELHSYVLIGKSTAIIVRGRKDTDKIEYNTILLIVEELLMNRQDIERYGTINKLLSVLPLRRWYSLRAY